MVKSGWQPPPPWWRGERTKLLVRVAQSWCCPQRALLPQSSPTNGGVVGVVGVVTASQWSPALGSSWWKGIAPHNGTSPKHQAASSNYCQILLFVVISLRISYWL